MTIEETLRDVADKFHRVGASYAARRLIDKHGMKMPQNTYDKILGDLLDDDAIEQIAVDGFEACVRALVAMGAETVMARDCKERR